LLEEVNGFQEVKKREHRDERALNKGLVQLRLGQLFLCSLIAQIGQTLHAAIQTVKLSGLQESYVIHNQLMF
jgi:hypothetical protein